jgi:hypothetical protein
MVDDMLCALHPKMCLPQNRGSGKLASIMGVDYIAELAAFGLVLAELRGRRDET